MDTITPIPDEHAKWMDDIAERVSQKLRNDPAPENKLLNTVDGVIESLSAYIKNLAAKEPYESDLLSGPVFALVSLINTRNDMVEYTEFHVDSEALVKAIKESTEKHKWNL